MSDIKMLLHYLGPHRRDFALAAVCIWVEGTLERLIPYFTAGLIDRGIVDGDLSVVWASGAKMLACGVAAMVFGMAFARFSSRAAMGLGANLRDAEYEAIQSYAFENLDHFDTSSLVTRMTTDVTVIQNAITTGFRPMMRGPVMLVMGLALACALSAELACVFFVLLPVLACALVLIVRRVAPLYRVLQGAMDQLNDVVQECLTAIRAVKAFVRGEWVEERFGVVNGTLANTATKTFRFAVLNTPLFQAIMYTADVLILLIGGQMILAGTLKVGEAGPDGSVEFRDVSFKYRSDAEANVLEGVTLAFPAGSTVGILGGTGSGKSSLVQLLPRLYDATAGSVLVGGHDVRAYDVAALRDAVGIVLQKNVLFSGTVRDNLRWGNEGATDAELLEACRIACADEFLDRTGGLDGDLGQGGVNVSGGQKQRLCIARALVKHPKVLVFDDSTSAVDMATDAKIRAGLAALGGMTKIVIAQRVASVMDADQIVILDEGHVHAVGTHVQLLARDPIYQELYRTQGVEGGEA